MPTTILQQVEKKSSKLNEATQLRGDSIFHKPLEFMEAYKYVHMCNV